jgi:hypothetical protein
MPSIPASLQPGIPNESHYSQYADSMVAHEMPADYNYHSGGANGEIVTQLSPPPAAHTIQTGPMMGRDGYIRPPNQWFGRDSIASMPRLGNIKGWANNQSGRVNNDEDRSAGGPYMKM